MEVTKQQIQQGVVKYLENDVVKAIKDKPVMMAMAVLATMVKNSGRVIEEALDNPVVAVLLSRNSNGTYDLTGLFEAIEEVIETYGSFEVRLPLLKAPFVFNKEDFKHLQAYIEGGV